MYCATGPAVPPYGPKHTHAVRCVGSPPLQKGVPYHTHQLGDFITTRSTFQMPPSPKPFGDACCDSCAQGGSCGSQPVGIFGLETSGLVKTVALGAAAYFVWTRVLSPTQRRKAIVTAYGRRRRRKR